MVFTATGLSLVWEFSLQEASAISSPQPGCLCCSEHEARFLTASRCPGPRGHGPRRGAGWASESSCCLSGAQQEPEPCQQLALQRMHCSGTEERSWGQAELQQRCPVSCRMQKQVTLPSMGYGSGHVLSVTGVPKDCSSCSHPSLVTAHGFQTHPRRWERTELELCSATRNSLGT